MVLQWVEKSYWRHCCHTAEHFCSPLSVHFPFRSDVTFFLLLTRQINYFITFLHNDTNDKFVNAHNGLALPEFVPYSILKNIHAV